jgi:hypothetical protein
MGWTHTAADAVERAGNNEIDDSHGVFSGVGMDE